MSGQVYFGNNGNISFLCIGYYLLYLFLRIETSVRCSVILAGVVSYYCFRTLRADLCQSRIFLNFNSPSLIFCQVPVESIHIMQSQQVDILFYKLYREKVTSYIEMHTSITETWIVFNGYCRKCDLGTGNYCRN